MYSFKMHGQYTLLSGNLNPSCRSNFETSRFCKILKSLNFWFKSGFKNDSKVAMSRKFSFLFCLVLSFHSFGYADQINVDFGQNIETTSQVFLEKSFQWGPLGEGEDGEYDLDPLYRWDLFDCQTYVETVLALHRSEDFAAFEENMNAVRYQDGMISYTTRLHFSETQWIPENAKNGVFEDVTDSFDHAAHVTVQVNTKAWYQNKKITDLSEQVRNEETLKKFQSLGSDHPDVVDVGYIPVEFLNKELLDTIPSGSIILTMRKNSKPEISATPAMVAHMGFVIVNETGHHLRHASSKQGKVTDEDLAAYYHSFKTQTSAFGIKILKVVE